MNVSRFVSTWRLAQSLRCLSAATSSGLQNRCIKLNRPLALSPTFASALCSTAASAAPEKSGTMATKHEFQAETRQLLDIVARSLYSEKEVFIRELVCSKDARIFACI